MTSDRAPATPSGRPAPAGELEVRRAAATESELLFAAYRAGRWDELEAAGFPPAQAEAFLADQWRIECAARDVDHPGHEHRLVFVEGELAGRIHVHLTPKRLLLLDLLLVAAARNRGVGTLLLADLSCEAAAAGVPLVLHVERWSPALRLYARLGFVVRAESDTHLEMQCTAPIAPGPGEPRTGLRTA